jgi:hypothetical protein
MADEKIVTKKTAAKPAAATTKTGAAPAVQKTPEKKAVAKAPAAPVAPRPPLTKAPATAAKSAPPVAAPAPEAPAPKAAKKAPVKRGEAVKPGSEGPNPMAPLEDKPVSLQQLAQVTPEQRQDMIREAAYFRAEKRSFAQGFEAQDWADAEREIDELIARAKEIFGG